MSFRPTRARIWTDSISEGATCRSCQKAIIWATFCKSGKKMPFDRLVVLSHGTDEDHGGREYQTVDLTPVHWATCPQAAAWKGRGHGQPAPASRGRPDLDVARAVAELEQARTWLREHWRETGHPRVSDIGHAVGRALRALGRS